VDAVGSVTARGARRIHFAWVILGGTALAMLAASGVRSAFGDYTVAFYSAALVAFAATVMVLAIQERPVSRRPPEAVVVAPAAGV
jgi:hypothetical protein